MAISRTFKPHDGKTLPCRADQMRTEYIELGSKLRLRVSRTGDRAWSIQYWSPLVKKPRCPFAEETLKLAAFSW